MRPQWEAGSTLSAHDLSLEQRYRGQRLRRHNRHLHGWGVVCGLLVVPARDRSSPWTVRVCPGFAIGPHGDDIEVPAAALIDVRAALWRRPVLRRDASSVVHVAIRYAATLTRERAITPADCGCPDAIAAPARIRDGFALDVLWHWSDDARLAFDVCRGGTAPCPHCRDSASLVLASITLPGSENDPIAAVHIDNWTHRRRLASTSLLQRQVMESCCEPRPGPCE
jgi:hypothetical protein